LVLSSNQGDQEMKKVTRSGLAALGFVLAVFGAQSAKAQEGDAAFAVSPESAYSLLDRAISEATTSIDVNIYMLTNRNVTKALADKAAAGVKVTVLMEGDANSGTLLTPVKKVLDDFNQDLKTRAPQNSHFYVMWGQNGNVQRRYVYDHAKYLVIDQKKVFVSSENFTGGSFGDKNQTGGTRGWQMEVENSALAAQLGAIFSGDANPRSLDVVTYDNAALKVQKPTGNLPPPQPRDVQTFAMQTGQVQTVTLCTSPNSLNCILDFINTAKTDLVVEHLEMPLYWVDNAKNKTFNPIVQAFLDAARRGVRVRVLLNDDSSFSNENVDPDTTNAATVNWLNSQAAAGKLPLSLEAATFSNSAVEVSYVHNKGMVADGHRAFVGSINGSENAVDNNREVALAVDSTDAANYFGGVFDFDWGVRKQ
jgi:cardiolipin synthase A/B